MTTLSVIMQLFPCGALLVLTLFGFSKAVRLAIGHRDQWTCQVDGCGKQFRDGHMVHAAHYPEHHSKSDPLYDTTEGGRILCVEHHVQDHLDGTSLGHHGDSYALDKLSNTDHRTIEYRNRWG